MKLRELSSSALAIISLLIAFSFVALLPSFSDPAQVVKTPYPGTASATNSAPASVHTSGFKGDAAAKGAPLKKGADAPSLVKASASGEASKVSAGSSPKDGRPAAPKALATASGQSADKPHVPAKGSGKDAASSGALAPASAVAPAGAAAVNKGAAGAPPGQKAGAAAVNKDAAGAPAGQKAGAAAVDKSAAGAPAGQKAGETKATPKAASKSSAASNSGRKHSANRDQLIPPPPPVQPSLMIGPDFAGGGSFIFDGMNKEELGSKAKDLGQQLKDMQDVLKEKQDRVQDAKDKAARFKPLFEEGVVSRHELESAEKEAVDAERELDRINRRVSEFETQKQTVESRLKDLTKRSVPEAPRGKKKKR
jgi:hypothetical protein